MDIQVMKTFFMWCAILNIGLLTGTFLIWVVAADSVYKLHGKWFPMPRESYNVVFYSFLGVYKIVVYVFNIVPWLALTIMG